MWNYTIWAIGDFLPTRIGSGKADFSGQAANQVIAYVEAVTPKASLVLQDTRVVHSSPDWVEFVHTYLDGYKYEVRFEQVISDFDGMPSGYGPMPTGYGDGHRIA